MDVTVGAGRFRCEMCGGIFDLGDDDEARTEAEVNGFNPKVLDDPDQFGLVCDDCHRKTPWGLAKSGEGRGNPVSRALPSYHGVLPGATGAYERGRLAAVQGASIDEHPPEYKGSILQLIWQSGWLSMIGVEVVKDEGR
jgi:hypothetical protein